MNIYCNPVITCNYCNLYSCCNEELFPLQMFVCELCLLNPAILAVSGLSGVLGTLGQILLSCLVHMHSRLRSLRQG
jgi:hypothetical protein